MLHDAVLMALAIKGAAKADALGAAAAAPAAAVEAELVELAAAGLAEQTKVGWRLTPAGRAAAHGIGVAERAKLAPDEIDARYEEFVKLNDHFKATIMAWQLRDVGGTSIPNDHADRAYDEDVLARIAAIDAEMRGLVDWLGERVERMRAYRQRFTHALERAMHGERRFVAAPLIDSYHTVWFELHEELIRLCGKTRAGEAAAGRGA